MAQSLTYAFRNIKYFESIVFSSVQYCAQRCYWNEFICGAFSSKLNLLLCVSFCHVNASILFASDCEGETVTVHWKS